MHITSQEHSCRVQMTTLQSCGFVPLPRASAAPCGTAWLLPLANVPLRLSFVTHFDGVSSGRLMGRVLAICAEPVDSGCPESGPHNRNSLFFFFPFLCLTAEKRISSCKLCSLIRRAAFRIRPSPFRCFHPLLLFHIPVSSFARLFLAPVFCLSVPLPLRYYPPPCLSACLHDSHFHSFNSRQRSPSPCVQTK